MITEKQEPQPGDLIWADRGAYHHCGIYEGAGYVIHFASPEGSEISPETAVVHRTTYENFQSGCPVKVIKIEGSYLPEETLRRARNCIGTRGYNLATFNCDHFSLWCKTGEYHSIQVDNIKAGLKELELEGTSGLIIKTVCEIHDIAEILKMPRLDKEPSTQEEDILDTIDLNASMTEIIPPVINDENCIYSDFEIIEEESENEIVEYTIKEGDMDEGDGDLSPAKKAWYERVGDNLKGLTYPIAGALEELKLTGRLPALKNIDLMQLGAKVRNVIDNIVTAIKVFTGRLTTEQGYQERMNNETALAGQIIQQKQKQPVTESLKQVFGKTGSSVKHFVQQAITRIVPTPVRTAIRNGAQLIGKTVARGIKSFVQRAKQGVTNFFGQIKQKFFN